jgi:hypothetical protein
MTCETRFAALVVAALGLTAGCGNYSNEDLEFMNAVPDHSDLSADLPVRSPLLSTNEAELAKSTHNVVKLFNGTLASVLGLVEAIRSYEPTVRAPDSRIWGPVPADKQPGWQWRFWLKRQPDQSFTYAFELEPLDGGPNGWMAFITGAFQPSPGIRRGVGNFTLDTTALRAGNFPFDIDTARTQSIAVSYSTKEFPRSVMVDLVNYPDYPDLGATNSVHYEYGMQADGEGALKFTLTGDLIKTTAAIEVLAVTSQWLRTGAGRADLTVLQGDGAGLMQVECWNSEFEATYNEKPWSPAENTGDSSACPQIPTF